MGRIIASITITNAGDESKSLRCDALVDTGAALTVLPNAWKDRLGELEQIRKVILETATQEAVTGQVCGPVRIQIEGFQPIFGEVLFIERNPADGLYEPLIGYITLETSQAGVDMLGHRLVPIKHLDLK
jgi:predicted aspartyl protease